MTDRLNLPDVNVLFALIHAGHAHHQLAHAWFDDVVRFATTPLTEAGLMRLSLNPAITGSAVSVASALASLRSIRSDPRASFLTDDATFGDPRIELTGLVGHRQVSNLHLVDLAARHDAVLVTFDRALPAAVVAADRSAVRLIG